MGICNCFQKKQSTDDDFLNEIGFDIDIDIESPLFVECISPSKDKEKKKDVL